MGKYSRRKEISRKRSAPLEGRTIRQHVSTDSILRSFSSLNAKDREIALYSVGALNPRFCPKELPSIVQELLADSQLSVRVAASHALAAILEWGNESFYETVVSSGGTSILQACLFDALFALDHKLIALETALEYIAKLIDCLSACFWFDEALKDESDSKLVNLLIRLLLETSKIIHKHDSGDAGNSALLNVQFSTCELMRFLCGSKCVKSEYLFEYPSIMRESLDKLIGMENLVYSLRIYVLEIYMQFEIDMGPRGRDIGEILSNSVIANLISSFTNYIQIAIVASSVENDHIPYNSLEMDISALSVFLDVILTLLTGSAAVNADGEYGFDGFEEATSSGTINDVCRTFLFRYNIINWGFNLLKAISGLSIDQDVELNENYDLYGEAREKILLLLKLILAVDESMSAMLVSAFMSGELPITIDAVDLFSKALRQTDARSIPAVENHSIKSLEMLSKELRNSEAEDRNIILYHVFSILACYKRGNRRDSFVSLYLSLNAILEEEGVLENDFQILSQFIDEFIDLFYDYFDRSDDFFKDIQQVDVLGTTKGLLNLVIEAEEELQMEQKVNSNEGMADGLGDPEEFIYRCGVNIREFLEFLELRYAESNR